MPTIDDAAGVVLLVMGVMVVFLVGEAVIQTIKSWRQK